VKKFPTNTELNFAVKDPTTRERSKTVTEGIPEPVSMTSFSLYMKDKDKRDKRRDSNIEDTTKNKDKDKIKLRVMKGQPSQDKASEKTD